MKKCIQDWLEYECVSYPVIYIQKLSKISISASPFALFHLSFESIDIKQPQESLLQNVDNFLLTLFLYLTRLLTQMLLFHHPLTHTSKIFTIPLFSTDGNILVFHIILFIAKFPWHQDIAEKGTLHKCWRHLAIILTIIFLVHELWKFEKFNDKPIITLYQITFRSALTSERNNAY